MDYVHRNTQKSLIFAYLIKTCFLYSSLDFYNDIYPIWCTVALGTLTYYHLKVFFLPSIRKVLLLHTVDNEVSALVSLTFYENLLISQKPSVHCPHQRGVHIKQVGFRENVRAFLRENGCLYTRLLSKT